MLLAININSMFHCSRILCHFMQNIFMIVNLATDISRQNPIQLFSLLCTSYDQAIKLVCKHICFLVQLY